MPILPQPAAATQGPGADALARLLDARRPAVVLVEACALAGWVHDLRAERGVRCLVANTASDAWKFKHARRETDRDDARRLADRYRLGQVPEGARPPSAPPGGNSPKS